MPTFPRPLLNMMEHAYTVRNGAEHFETYETSKIQGALKWVAIPTKHDGRGYLRAAQSKNGVQALCGWWSLLQVAAKMPVRWLLADRDGPLDAEDIAIKTTLPSRIYLVAFELMATDKIRWLEKVPWDGKLDFAGNIASLIRLQHLPATALDFQRPAAANSRRQRKNKEARSTASSLSAQHAPAPNSTDAARPADDSGEQGRPASALIQDSTEQDRTFPLPSPEGGQGEDLRFDQAKQFLNAVFGREKRNWSREEDGLLVDHVPINRADAELIKKWFRLPEDHPVFEKTKRKQELTTFLRDFNGELDKIRRFAPVFVQLNGSNGAKKEPPAWRQTLRWLHGEQIVLPERFEQLGLDLRKEYEGNYPNFKETPEGQTA